MTDEILNGLFDLLAVFLFCAIPLCVAGVGAALWMRWLEKRKPLPAPAYDERNWQEQFEKEWHA